MTWLPAWPPPNGAPPKPKPAPAAPRPSPPNTSAGCKTSPPSPSPAAAPPRTSGTGCWATGWLIDLWTRLQANLSRAREQRRRRQAWAAALRRVERAQLAGRCLVWLTSWPSAPAASRSAWRSAAGFPGTAASALCRLLDRLAPRRQPGRRLAEAARRLRQRLLRACLLSLTRSLSRTLLRHWWRRSTACARTSWRTRWRS